MPTMSSAKPLRNSESVELHPSCIYGVDLGHGSFTVINYLMVRDLKSLGVWNKELVKHLIINEGHLDKLHEFLANTNCDKERLAHLQKKYIGMMKLGPLLVKKRNFRRNKYICQSTSSNVCIADARIDILEALFMIDGELGNKTVQYYLYQESQVRNVTLAKVETHKSENVMKCENGLCCSS
jgi:ribonucleotide reductase alpha subunit